MTSNDPGRTPDIRPEPHDTLIKTPLWVLILRWVALAAACAVGAIAISAMLPKGTWLGIVLVSAVAMGALLVYGSHRAIPMKYLYVGLILLVSLQVWPIFYTVATAFTNYGDGHSISKQDAIGAIERDSVQEVAGSPRYLMTVTVKEGTDKATAPIYLLLVDPKDKSDWVGDAKGLTKLDPAGLKLATNGRITAAPGFTPLNAKEVNARKDFQKIAIPKDAGAIKPIGLTAAFEGAPTVTYDAATDTLTDTKAKKTYRAENALWVAEDGTYYPQGWQENVGFKNFLDLFRSKTIQQGFLKIFVWNVVFALTSVVTTFLLGMLLALLFNHPRMKFRGLGRSILIMPYALPGFVTALIWHEMFNKDYGLINTQILHNTGIAWLEDPTLAKLAVLITNLWLGFPYMFLITTGALQAIPSDIKEAAAIDGATGFQQIRHIIMPLLLVAVGPLLIASFSFNFNNFSLIFLLTGGGPMDSADTTIGNTDLLISYAFRLAFGGVGARYGLASAISILIFLIVAGLSLVGFKYSKAWEDVN